MYAGNPKREAFSQLLLTCAATVVFFSLFALFHTSSSASRSLTSRISEKAHIYFSARDADVDKFSWHQCVGGAEWGNSGERMPGEQVRQRSCHFKNVCVRLVPIGAKQYDTDLNATIELTYYKSPMLLGGPQVWSTSQPADAPWLMSDRNHYLSKKDVYEPMPTNVQFVKTPSVLMGSFWPHNFGHALGDDMFPAFRLLRNFGLVRKDNYYIFHQSCQQRGGDVGCKNAMSIAETLTSRPYQQAGGELFPDADTTTCFADVVMGPSELTMRQKDERSWPDMVQHMKEQVGLRPNSQLKKHKVVIIEKHGRRTWLNYQAVREHVEQEYGVEAVLVNPAELSVPEQLALFEETTVLITPPGGISFSSTFLHKDSVAIYVEWWSESHGRSFPMDQEVYTWNADVHPLFYPLSRSDLTLDRSALDGPTLANNSDDQLWQGWANVTINLPRLDLYLRTAFAHSSLGLGIKLPQGLRP
ncbi:hypothetical protein JCM8547_008602 [Rhodosporidiobolus lusitaniae]